MSKSITDAQWHCRLDVLWPQTIITPLTVAFYFFHLLLCSTPVTCWQWVSLQCGRLPAWLPGLELGSIMCCFLCVFSLDLYIACKSSLNCCKWSSFKPDAFLLDTELWKWGLSCQCFHIHACKKTEKYSLWMSCTNGLICIQRAGRGCLQGRSGEQSISTWTIINHSLKSFYFLQNPSPSSLITDTSINGSFEDCAASRKFHLNTATAPRLGVVAFFPLT